MNQQIQNQQTPINIDPAIKGLTEVRVMYNDMQFILLAIAGNLGEQFLVSPQHMKKLLVVLNNTIENYEKTFGKINVSSPVEKEPIGFSPTGFRSK